MKKIIITTFLTLCASLAYAGSGCGGCSGDKKGDKDKEAGLTESSITLACATSCGEGDKKGKNEGASSLSNDTTLLAGSCGGCGGGKKGGDTSGDDKTDGFTAGSLESVA